MHKLLNYANLNKVWMCVCSVWSNVSPSRCSNLLILWCFKHKLLLLLLLLQFQQVLVHLWQLGQTLLGVLMMVHHLLHMLDPSLALQFRQILVHYFLLLLQFFKVL